MEAKQYFHEPAGMVHLHWVDYLVLAAALVFSSSVGIFHAYRDRKLLNSDEYLMAGRRMGVFPVAISMYVSWFSAISFLGDPVEVYYRGIVYWLYAVAYVLAFLVVARWFAPVFHKARITSAFQLLKRKYNNKMRLLGSLTSGLSSLMYLGIVLYAPSLALSQVTGMDVRVLILIVACVSTFYTTLGGMKAVLWADTLQTTVMVAGLIAVLVQGNIKVGGFSNVWKIAQEAGRINFSTAIFRFSLLDRYTLWVHLVGGFCRILVSHLSVQMFVQRFCMVKSPQDASLVTYIQIPLFVATPVLLGALGLTMFAYFYHCDPVLSGRVQRPDQMLPLMMLEVLQHAPGVPGIFIACIIFASLSTLSSGQSALATTFLTDLAQPLYYNRTGRAMSDRLSTWLAKATSVVLGVTMVLLALLILYGGGSIFQMTVQVTGTLGGPICGLFILAVLCPFVNTLDAFIGFCVAIFINLWLTVGGFWWNVPQPKLSTSIDGCLVQTLNWTALYNDTLMKYSTVYPESNLTVSSIIDVEQGFVAHDLYSWLAVMYAPLGMTSTLLASIIVSAFRYFIARCCSKSNSNYVVSAKEQEMENI